MDNTHEKIVPAGKKSPHLTSKAVTKNFTPEEMRTMLVKHSYIEGDLDQSLKQLAEKYHPEWMCAVGEAKENAHKIFQSKTTGVMIGLEMETHVALMASFNEDYRGLAKELSQRLMQEFTCTNSAEIMLVETIVNAYIRLIDNSKRFNDCINAGEYITPNRTQYLAMLSKQIDRAQRQHLTALMSLKQLKAPTVEMNIRAHTAFVATNQQVNSDKSIV